MAQAPGRDPSDGHGRGVRERSPMGVDWDDAATVAGRLVRPGPASSRQEREDLVAGLRRAAHRAAGHIAEITGMAPADGRDPAGGLVPVHVVDRPRWAQANARSLDSVLGPVYGRLDRVESGSARIELVGSLQAGALLALLATRVLGQYDQWAPPSRPGGSPGRLLLVAPNVLEVQRSLAGAIRSGRGLPAEDFWLWVCLHEQAHVLQFAAAPWLAGHLRSQVEELLGGLVDDSRALTSGPVSGRWRSARELAARARAGMSGAAPGTWAERLLTADQRRVYADVSAVMSLLEGHADVTMDAVGPDVLPGVDALREAFERRRDQTGGGAVVLRRLMGMDVKIAQYRDGARFVRAVTDRVGRDGLNAVWAGPQSLPRRSELADPGAWVRRVHG